MYQTSFLNQHGEIVKRSVAIHIICVLGFIGTGVSIAMLFSEIASQMGIWFRPYVGVATLVNLICMIGLWQTKKWGLYGILLWFWSIK